MTPVGVNVMEVIMGFGSLGMLAGGGALAGGAAIPLVATAGAGGTDMFNAYTNYKNYQLQKEQYGYQKELQGQVFAREDNATQRRVADLRAAGLSPTLAAGSAAGAGSVVSTNVPQMDKMPPMAANALSLLKQQADISLTSAQKDLVDMQRAKTGIDADATAWDLRINKNAGVASNASGLGKIFRDALGVLSPTTNTVGGAKGALVDRVKSNIEADKTRERRVGEPEGHVPIWQRLK